MSFLNALASDGLSVGLRFYNAKMNGRSVQQVLEREPVAAGEAREPACQAKIATAAAHKNTARPAAPLTAEEMAAGRAEARSRLVEGGYLGLLQAAAGPEKNEAETAEAAVQTGMTGFAATETLSGVAEGMNDGEKQKAARLQAREDQIRAEVNASVQKGVPGADAVQYSYTTGPDGQRYVSGIEGGLGSTPEAAKKDGGSWAAGPARELSSEEERQVQDMRDRDREVKAHERAHVAAAAGLAGAPVYEYQIGPDGKRYAVGGHVDLQTGGRSDPEKALSEAETVKRAAMAPASPSGPDMAAASKASAEANRLRAEKVSEDPEEEGQTGQAEGSTKDQKPTGGTLAEPYGRPGSDQGPVYNGSGFGRQVINAYAAYKLGVANSVRPVLARV